MALIFAVRGTQLKPYYSRGSSEYATAKQSASSADAAVAASAATGAFGASVIQFNTTRTALLYAGRANWVENKAFAVIARIVPLWTGTPAATQYIVNIADDNAYFMCGLTVRINTAGKAVIALYDSRGTALIAATSASALSFTTDVTTDIMVEWDGTTAANSVKLYQDGSLLESFSPGTPSGTWNNGVVPVVFFGNAGTVAQLFHVNEFLIFNATQGAYSPRADFYSTSALNGDTLPAVGDVRLATVVGLLTGTAAIPAASHVRSGTAIDNTTGTAAIPTAANVRAGTATDATVGTLAVPTAAQVLSGVSVDNTTGTYVAPTAAQVQEGVAFGASSALTGTLVVAENVLSAQYLTHQYTAATDQINVVQGDDLYMDFVAMAADGTAMDLTNASIALLVKGSAGDITIPNADVTISSQAVPANLGKFRVRLHAAVSVLLDVANKKNLLATITQGSIVTHLHGRDILNVTAAAVAD